MVKTREERRERASDEDRETVAEEDCLAQSRRCSACGAQEVGQVRYHGLGEQTYFELDVVGRVDSNTDRKVVTGASMALQAMLCQRCGHVDLYTEVVPPTTRG